MCVNAVAKAREQIGSAYPEIKSCAWTAIQLTIDLIFNDVAGSITKMLPASALDVIFLVRDICIFDICCFCPSLHRSQFFSGRAFMGLLMQQIRCLMFTVIHLEHINISHHKCSAHVGQHLSHNQIESPTLFCTDLSIQILFSSVPSVRHTASRRYPVWRQYLASPASSLFRESSKVRVFLRKLSVVVPSGNSTRRK